MWALGAELAGPRQEQAGGQSLNWTPKSFTNTVILGLGLGGWRPDLRQGLRKGLIGLEPDVTDVAAPAP
jgi:hypothetical protein